MANKVIAIKGTRYDYANVKVPKEGLIAEIGVPDKDRQEVKDVLLQILREGKKNTLQYGHSRVFDAKNLSKELVYKILNFADNIHLTLNTDIAYTRPIIDDARHENDQIIIDFFSPIGISETETLEGYIIKILESEWKENDRVD